MVVLKKGYRSAIRLGIIVNLGLAVIFAVSALYLVNETRKQAQEQALQEAELKAQLILDRNLAIHTYYSHILKPKLFELTDAIRNDDYFEPAWMSSTFAVREIDNNFKSLNDSEYYYKECAINARSPQNEADAFERKFIEELNVNPRLQYRSLVRMLDGKYYYVTLRRGEVMEKTCLRCHSTPEVSPRKLVDIYGTDRSFGRKEGEVVSAISIRVPLSAAYASAIRFSKHISTVLIVTFFILFGAQYFLYRMFVLAPIQKLRKRALQISENDNLLGEEIALPAGHELGELTYAFNIMSLKLRNHMDLLEETVEKRTRKLKKANAHLQKAVDEIKTLRGIIPICMYCKKIRDDEGYWNKIEEYFAKHSEARFSHGMCEECFKKYYPEDAGE